MQEAQTKTGESVKKKAAYALLKAWCFIQ